VRLTAAESSLRRHRKLRLARPWASASGEVSASPNPRAWPPPRPRKMDSASPNPRARPPPRPRKMDSASPDPGLDLDLGRWSPPRPTPGLDLGRWSPPRPTLGPGLNLDRGRNRVLARPRPRPQEESPPRPTLGSDRPRYRGCIITLPLASSGYGGTRPGSHPGSPR
jgi:hypothetical protein